MRIRLTFATTLLVCSLAACGNPTGEPPRPTASHLEGPSDQIGGALEVLPDIAVAVTGTDGKPVSDVAVLFTVVDGAGTLSAPMARSDALGNARVQWTLGPRTGAQHLKATVADNPAVTTTVTATARQQVLGARQGQSIVLVNVDNAAQKAVYPGIVRSVAWSPDGRRVAFAGKVDNGTRNGIYVMNADGTGLTTLTTPTLAYDDQDVDWSPDGARLVFARESSTGGRIFVMNANGTGLAQLTNTASATPRWSPDGTRIAFALQSLSSTATEIAVMNADGSNVRYVTTNQGGNSNPDWSPDGSRLVYTSGRAAQPQLYVIGVDGTGEHLLTTTFPANHMYDDDAAWSRDGSVIAFVRAVMSADGATYSTGLYTIPPDGSASTLITSGPGAWETPRWRP